MHLYKRIRLILRNRFTSGVLALTQVQKAILQSERMQPLHQIGIERYWVTYILLYLAGFNK